MPHTVFVLHTTFALVEPLKPLFAELLPGVRVVNQVDDSLLADVRAAGGLTPSVVRRIVGYGVLAESAGADAILNCCSSVGEAADLMQQAVAIPVVKIDDRMATKAAAAGSRVAVIATLPTTLDPTARLIERKAAAHNSSVTVQRRLAEGAYDALMAGDTAGHDRLVVDEVRRAAEQNDVVVLAQGSMARIVPQVEGTVTVPVLSSPRLGVLALQDALEQRGTAQGA